MLVIGNGESRSHIDLAQADCVKVGCNAVLRDYKVDHLICCDRRMVQEAVNANYNKHAKIYTRKDWIDYFRRYENVYTVPDLPYQGSQRWDDPFHWGSGPYAVLLAAQLSTGHCDLVGFDLYGNGKLVNNLYKNTENYAKSVSRNVDPRYWIVQIAKVFELFPQIQFTVYNHNDWICPDIWKKHNIKVDTYSNLL